MGGLLLLNVADIFALHLNDGAVAKFKIQPEFSSHEFGATV
jgi:hypothetical protein